MTYTYNNIALTLIHQAYVTDDGCYEALATDANKNQYVIVWDPIETDSLEQDDACDWSTYTVVAL